MLKQRLIRVLVYEGTPEEIQDSLKRRSVKGSFHPRQGCSIREAIVGDFLETLIPINEIEDGHS
jgi:hypothetical protein